VSALEQQAIALHQKGRLADAERLYQQALAQEPGAFGPHYYLGVIRMQQGRLGEALPFLEAALKLNPDEITALVNHGMTLRLLRRPQEALAPLGRAVALRPEMAEVHAELGLALTDAGRASDALAAVEQALRLQPLLATALFQRALLLGDLGRDDEVLAAYDALLAAQPNHVEGLSNRALLSWQRRETQAALDGWARALAAAPNHLPSLVNRALLLGELGRFAEALADYDRLVSLAADNADLWNRRGGTLQALGRSREALASFDQALRLNPDLALARSNRGHLLWTFERRYDEAKADLAHALALEPEQPYLKGEYAYLRMQGCEWDGRDEELAALTADVAAGKRVVRPFAWQALCADPASLQQCARIFARDSFAATPNAPRPGAPKDRIRIGYVSADFRDQATAQLMAGVYEAHDRTKFDIIAFDNGHDDRSPMRARLHKAFGGFIDISGMNDARAAETVRAAGIDILVNLNGYFGRPRNGLFALRPAPVQVNYLGFPGTLGAPFMDYIVADETVIPEAHRGFYDEAVAWLPGCYQANDAARPVPQPVRRDQAGLPQGGFVFANFNQLYKLTPDIFAIWMRVLKACEGSVLWLLRDNDTAVANLWREAERHGVVPQRVIFAEPLPLERHMERLALADLVLDTLPYNAHTTASDALWAGVPLLTCKGSAFPGRVAASLLQAAGLPELITGSLAEYEALAVALAKDPARLSGLRLRLAENRASCALFDTARFTRRLEAAFTTMLARAHDGGPKSFAVSDAL
jgi:protein O-GlcNAc transferase